MVLSRAGVTAEELSKIGAILALPHSERVIERDRYAAVLKTIAGVLKEQDLRLAVKYHPRESNGNYLSGIVSDLTVLPRALPLESVFLWSAESLQFILGDVSTAFFTGPWLVPGVTPVSFARLLSGAPPDLLRAYGVVGVVLPGDSAALGEALRGPAFNAGA